MRFATILALALGWWSSVYPAPCVLQSCSNDGPPLSKIGDEQIAWTQIAAWVQPNPSPPVYPASASRCYRIGRVEDSSFETVCERVNKSNKWTRPSTTYFPYRTGVFPRVGQTYHYRVMACDAASATCSPAWSNTVEFVGQAYICFGFDSAGGCEAPCYAGAPDRLPLRACQ